jgi:hypothetical protein
MHTKAAAGSMLDEIKTISNMDDINVGRINRNGPELEKIREFIHDIHIGLINADIIEYTPPNFNLGSTRLIARELGGFDHPDTFETRAIYDSALAAKETFGDIDVGINLTKSSSFTNVKDFIKAVYPDRAAFKRVGDELSVGFLVDKVVYQIDFVDLSKNPERVYYNQFSSWLDINAGLKGLVREILAGTKAKTTHIDSSAKTMVKIILTGHQDFIRTKCKCKEGDQLILDRIRWSLGNDFLKMIAVYRKIKNGKELKTPYNIEIWDVIFNSSEIDPEMATDCVEQINPRVSYGSEGIANYIGFSSDANMYHSVKMLQDIRLMSLDDKQEFWNSAIKALNRKRPTATAGGSLSNEEADYTIDFMKPYFEGVDYDQVNG